MERICKFMKENGTTCNDPLSSVDNYYCQVHKSIIQYMPDNIKKISLVLENVWRHAEKMELENRDLHNRLHFLNTIIDQQIKEINYLKKELGLINRDNKIIIPTALYALPLNIINNNNDK